MSSSWAILNLLDLDDFKCFVLTCKHVYKLGKPFIGSHNLCKDSQNDLQKSKSSLRPDRIACLDSLFSLSDKILPCWPNYKPKLLEYTLVAFLSDPSTDFQTNNLDCEVLKDLNEDDG